MIWHSEIREVKTKCIDMIIIIVRLYLLTLYLVLKNLVKVEKRNKKCKNNNKIIFNSSSKRVILNE